MKRKRYPRYKESGIQWLGEIPEGWETKRLKLLLSEPLKYGANESAEFEDPTCPRYVRITDVSESGYLRDDTFKSLPENIAQPYILKEGDLLFARSGATVGKIFLYLKQWGRAAYAGYLIRARLKISIYLPTFAAYFCYSNSYLDWINSIFIQSTIQNVNAEKYANLVFPVPPLWEQKKIVFFLDRETSRIDRLMEKKEKQVELLKEKRAALISHAVTKGLDPHVKMKDSGIDWLGEIPEHWYTQRIKNTSYVKGRIGWQGLKSDEFIDEGPYLVTGTDFINGRVNWATCYHVSEERYKEDPYIQLKENDLLITKDGTIGKTAIVRELAFNATLNSGVFVTRPKKSDYVVEFLYWVLNSDVFNSFINFTKTGTTISHLYQNVFVEFSFPITTLNEQCAIATFLDRETGKVDALVEKIQKSIALLKEYRTAIITAAVTGKIDVRDTL